MKKVISILIISFLIPFISQGQQQQNLPYYYHDSRFDSLLYKKSEWIYKDTVTKFKLDTSILDGIGSFGAADSIYITQGNGITFFNGQSAKPNLPETDTIRVILLVNDTDGNPMSYIIKGYSVRNRHNPNEESNGGWFCYSCKDYMKHSYYLDAKKKRLSSNIIVWMSQPAK